MGAVELVLFTGNSDATSWSCFRFDRNLTGASLNSQGFSLQRGDDVMMVRGVSRLIYTPMPC